MEFPMDVNIQYSPYSTYCSVSGLNFQIAIHIEYWRRMKMIKASKPGSRNSIKTGRVWKTNKKENNGSGS